MRFNQRRISRAWRGITRAPRPDWFPRPSKQQVLRFSVWAFLVACVSLVFAVTTARADMSFGPHRAHYAVTTTDKIVVDLGPLGTVELDSPLPFTLGVDALVEEIPDDVADVDQSQTLQALEGDLNSYLQFFSGIEATVSDVAGALARDAALRFALSLIVVGAASYGVFRLLGEARRRELTDRMRPHTVKIAGTVALVLVVTSVATSGTNRVRPDVGPTTTAVFSGTPLEGARITGRLAGVIDTYGGMLVEAYEDNEAFYGTVTANLSETWEEREHLDAVAARRAPFLNRGQSVLEEDGWQENAGETGQQGPGTQENRTDEGGGDNDENSDAEAQADGDARERGARGRAAASQKHVLAKQQDDVEPVTMLVVSDLHCNVGMAPVIKRAAELAGADLILNGGDTTMNGSTVERFCVTSFAEAAPDGVPFVAVTGNHDSAATAADMTDAGMTVLSGGVEEIKGVRILGDDDPNETRLGAGTQKVGDETTDQAGERLAQIACDASDGVDLLLVHTPRVGVASLESGCVPVQISGHTHRRIGPRQVGPGTQYVNGTTAGAVYQELTVGPLQGTAEMTVLRFDPEQRVMLDYQVLTFQQDQSVQVGQPLRFPRGDDQDLTPENTAEVPQDVAGEFARAEDQPEG